MPPPRPPDDTMYHPRLYYVRKTRRISGGLFLSFTHVFQHQALYVLRCVRLAVYPGKNSHVLFVREIKGKYALGIITNLMKKAFVWT